MEYRVLKYFLAVAREENITKASEALHLSQPALSRQLMQLEEELGTELFIRGKRRITLTPAGILLCRRAQEIIELTEKAGREVRSQEGELAGVISIGSGEGETFRLFSRLMVNFQEQHPRVSFDLYTNNGDFIRERLERGLSRTQRRHCLQRQSPGFQRIYYPGRFNRSESFTFQTG